MNPGLYNWDIPPDCRLIKTTQRTSKTINAETARTIYLRRQTWPLDKYQSRIENAIDPGNGAIKEAAEQYDPE